MDLYDRLFGDSSDDNAKKKEEPAEEVKKEVEEKASEAAPAPAEAPEIKWSTDFQKQAEENKKEDAAPLSAPSGDAPASQAPKSDNMEKALGNVGAALEEMTKAVEDPAATPVENSAEAPTTIAEQPLEKPVSKIGTEEQEKLMKPEEGDDRLFEQIDAFREKAQQLSAIIHSKQTKVSNLEALVGEKEAQNRYLASLANADEVTREEVQSYLDELVEQQKAEVGDSAYMYEPLIEKVDAMNASFSGMKDEVFDKVHTENLQAYKNVQSFIQENDKSEDNRIRITTEVLKLKKFFGFLIFLGIVDTAGIVFVILYLLNLLPWF